MMPSPGEDGAARAPHAEASSRGGRATWSTNATSTPPARSYSYKRGILFDLDLEHVLDLVARSWPADEGHALRRLDRTEGFVFGNIELAPRKGGRPRTATVTRLRRRLERLAQRAQLSGAIWPGSSPDRAASARSAAAPAAGGPSLDPGQPVAVGNAIRVTTSVAQAVGPWSVHALVDLARDVVKTQDAPGQPGRKRRR